jgi:hypothetical protein
VNCARDWWRTAQAAHRSGAAKPTLRVKVETQLPEDVDAFLASLSMEEPARRAPRAPEERHDPNESLDSIVARMGGEALLPAPRRR